MATVLLTRPRHASEALASELKHHGYDSVIEPLLVIEPLGTPMPDRTGLRAVMITSGNALEAGQGLAALFGLPCFCVGPRSAARAHALGFRDVHHAMADGVELARLIAAALPKAATDEKPPVLHICGQDVNSGAQDELARRGYRMIPWPVYAARPVEHLSETTADLLRQGKIDAVTVFSARTAATLKTLLQGRALEACCAGLAAIGLSEAVADALRPLPWKILAAAAAPTEEAMIASLKKICPVSGVPDDRRRKIVF